MTTPGLRSPSVYCSWSGWRSRWARAPHWHASRRPRHRVETPMTMPPTGTATPRRRTTAGARGTLWGIVLAVVLVALGPELAGRALVVVGTVVVTLGLVANIAASLPASHRWTPALQGALRRAALFAGPAFFVV